MLSVKSIKPLITRGLSPLLFLLMVVMMLDPTGAASGSFDHDEYSELRTYLRKSEGAKPLFFSSDKDLFEFTSNDNSRREFSQEFVSSNYDEVRAAASFGNWYFNKFLMENSISHLLVPSSSTNGPSISNKWGRHGSIDISLRSPFFTKVMTTSGKFPLTLYKVAQTEKLNSAIPNYQIIWGVDVRTSFYMPSVKYIEVGQYEYSVSSDYLNGPDISWVYGNGFGKSEEISFYVETKEQFSTKFRLVLEIKAAYGSYAPTQVVTLKLNEEVMTKVVSAGKSQSFEILVSPNDQIEIMSGLPCRYANSFDPDAGEKLQFCFGISEIRVFPL